MQTLYNRLHTMLAISQNILVGTRSFSLYPNLSSSIQMITLEPWEISHIKWAFLVIKLPSQY